MILLFEKMNTREIEIVVPPGNTEIVYSDVTFKTFMQNDCWNSNNEYIDNSIAQEITMNYNPQTRGRCPARS